MKNPDGVTGKKLCECCGNHKPPYRQSNVFGKGYCEAYLSISLCPPLKFCDSWIPKETYFGNMADAQRRWNDYESAKMRCLLGSIVWKPKEPPMPPRTCLQCKNRRVGQIKCHKELFQDKSIRPQADPMLNDWAKTCKHFTQEETPMELKVRRDKVMELAAKGCQFKEAMETLWPEEFEPEEIGFEMEEFYTRTEGDYVGDIYTPMWRGRWRGRWDLYSLSRKEFWGINLGNASRPNDRKAPGFRKLTGKITLER